MHVRFVQKDFLSFLKMKKLFISVTCLIMILLRRQKNERKKDLDFMLKYFSGTEFVEMKDIGHAGMALLRPEEMAERIKR